MPKELWDADRQTPSPVLSKEELDQRGRIIREMYRARDQREQAHDEFDGMTYEQYYETNSKAANSYIAPRQNPADTRVSAGTTLEKVETLHSAILNLNLEPNIKAFDDEQDEISELGRTMASLIKKSRSIENPDWDVKKPVAYKEMLDQGTVFLEETWVEWFDIEKSLADGFSWADGPKSLAKVWKEGTSKLRGECRVNVLSGPNVYLGNIKDFFIDSQPHLFTREIVTIEEAHMMFQKWKRWENVPMRLTYFQELRENVEMRDWSLLEVEKGFCEILKYQNVPRNELQIFLNGVPMLPVGFPLSFMTGKNMYTVAKGDINPISRFFAYSKSIPAKTKVDQQMLDELYRIMIWKSQKSAKNSLANNTGKKLTARIFDPGMIVDDVDPNRLQPIGDNSGVTQADFAMVQFFKSMIDQKSVSPMFEGQQTKQGTSATEIMELKKQGMSKLGLSIWGVTNLERRLAWLRLHNIVRYWTEKQDTRVNKVKKGMQDVFKKISVDDDFDDGTSGTRIIEFSERNPSPEQVLGEENLLARRTGRKVRKTYLNPKLLRQMQIYWEIQIEPTEKKSDALEAAQFIQGLQEVFTLFGPQSVNQEYAKKMWAQKRRVDYDRFFVKAPQGMPQGAQMPPGVQPPMGQPQQGPVTRSLNKSVSGAAQDSKNRTRQANPGSSTGISALARQ